MLIFHSNRTAPLLGVVMIAGMFTFSAMVPGPSAAGRKFYVDSAQGNDNNDGLSRQTPWKSLEKVNGVVFQAGDTLLFRAGSRFAGRLHPKGSGSQERPIVIDRYGEGAKPLIAAGGLRNEALLLENQDYWEIRNLQLTNTGPTRKAFRYGVRVRVWDYGTMRHIRLRDLDVRDVNGSLVKKDQGEGHGIVWENGGDRVKSRFDGLLIEGCHLVRTDRNGICGFTPYPSDDRSHRSTNVVIRNNLLEDIGGDGIKVWGCDGALVEHNVLRGARQRCEDYAAGIWPWASDRTLIQFNEVSRVKGKKDGQAFDSDAYTRETVFQYNYSHDNDGGFMLVCCSNNTGTVIRYNISQNDRTRLFHMAGGNENVRIHNNVFYVAKDSEVHLFLWTGSGERWTRNVQVWNNIFYVEGTGRNSSGEKRKPINDGTFITQAGFGGSRNIVFERNILFGRFQDVPEGWLQITSDPKLVAPGTGSEGFQSLDGYQLQPESPAGRAGVRVPDNGGRDFWGNALPEGTNPSIGAHEPR
ncbi:MAG: right-handed parallel beta-helix repeat-containing protein [Acidobacteriota bacterium]